MVRPPRDPPVDTRSLSSSWAPTELAQLFRTTSAAPDALASTSSAFRWSETVPGGMPPARNLLNAYAAPPGAGSARRQQRGGDCLVHTSSGVSTVSILREPGWPKSYRVQSPARNIAQVVDEFVQEVCGKRLDGENASGSKPQSGHGRVSTQVQSLSSGMIVIGQALHATAKLRSAALRRAPRQIRRCRSRGCLQPISADSWSPG